MIHRMRRVKRHVSHSMPSHNFSLNFLYKLIIDSAVIARYNVNQYFFELDDSVVI